MSKFTRELREYACRKKASDFGSLGCQFVSQIKTKKGVCVVVAITGLS